MFPLDVSYLQALTILLPDALPTLGSHSVYSCGNVLAKVSRKVYNYKVLLTVCV